MTNNLLLPTITVPTRINNSSKTLIDNIFTNDINPDSKSGNLVASISDHLASFLIIPKKNQQHLPKKHNLYTRNFKHFDRENFLLEYFSIDWTEELRFERNDANYSLGIFFEKINHLIDK